jgi:hypothetical protein
MGEAAMSLQHACGGIVRRFVLVLTGLILIASGNPSWAMAQAGPGDGESVTIDLNEVERSGIMGTATLTADDDQTAVDMRLEGDVQGNHPTHIHTGTCSNFDPNPLYPLETVVLEPVDDSGVSESTVDVSLEELVSGDYVILVHFSPEKLTDYLVCGEIALTSVTGAQEETASPPSARTGDAATEEPETESGSGHVHGGATDSTPEPGRTTSFPTAGSGLDNGRGSPSALGLAALAGLAMVLAVWLQRKRWR